MKKINLFLLIALTSLSGIQIKAQEEAAKAYSDQLSETYGVLAQVKEMSKEEEQKILKKLSPELKSKLEEIKKLSKEKYYQLLRQNSFPGVWSLSEDVPVAALGGFFGNSERSEQYKKQKELEASVELLALKFKNANQSEQSKIRTDLAAALSELFEIREDQKQEEVKSLEKRLQELKESLQMRKQNKTEIVNRRIQELLGNSKYLRW